MVAGDEPELKVPTAGLFVSVSCLSYHGRAAAAAAHSSN